MEFILYTMDPNNFGIVTFYSRARELEKEN